MQRLRKKKYNSTEILAAKKKSIQNVEGEFQFHTILTLFLQFWLSILLVLLSVILNLLIDQMGGGWSDIAKKKSDGASRRSKTKANVKMTSLFVVNVHQRPTLRFTVELRYQFSCSMRDYYQYFWSPYFQFYPKKIIWGNGLLMFLGLDFDVVMPLCFQTSAFILVSPVV